MTVDPAGLGRTVVGLMRRGEFGEVCDLFSPELGVRVSPEQLGGPWADSLAQAGPIVEVGNPVTESADPRLTTVKIPVHCEHEGFAVTVVVDDAGLLWGFHLRPIEDAGPPWTPPAYADPAAFTENDLIVGDGALAVPGTLSLPKSPGPLPAIVQLPGSGPMDRDNTMGSNKPLKDMAWGLASQGIAVLRFDKITRVHHDKFADGLELTLTTEYVDHAVAATRLLHAHPSIDPARIFVLGHSQGGTLAPRVAATEPTLAGLIILAGATYPPHHAIVRQYRHLAALQPGVDIDADPAVAQVTRQAALLDSPEFSVSTPANELPFGVPAAYWLELIACDPVATAARLDKPMLILQGGRDYQVTVADDLIGWQNGLAGRDDVTIRVYAADNHQFFSGSGISTPAEYKPPQHVDPAVVDDIAEWVRTHWTERPLVTDTSTVRG